MCVCVCYVCGGQLEEAAGGCEHQETIPWLFSTSFMVYFTCRQGHRTDSLTSPLKDNWWLIGAQLGSEVNGS